MPVPKKNLTFFSSEPPVANSAPKDLKVKFKDRDGVEKAGLYKSSAYQRLIAQYSILSSYVLGKEATERLVYNEGMEMIVLHSATDPVSQEEQEACSLGGLRK
ncbi:Uncharacterised protein [Legionella beliardensis]|uniref:Uncharacterized protein n=1 Tax=Legionella beliardensis TaxID=91822 RepID=A0A378JSM4_9GAMM|nr:hypothetical protein [Legionella beliardensis]STX55588.1 Uncharacterised protein [Legionella beliardensis]